MNYIYIIIAFILICIIIYIVINNKLVNETLNKPVNKILTYSSNGYLDRSFIQILNKYGLDRNDNSDIYFINDYTYAEKIISDIQPNQYKYINIIDGCDLISSKISLYNTLKYKYKDDVLKYAPKTYIFKNIDDYNDLKKEVKINDKYILKNNAQRQEGIKLLIYTSWNDIIMNEDNYTIIQKYIENPLIIGERKINMRIYLLLVSINDKLYGYIYDNGFIYYTQQKYDINKFDFAHHITTGYIDRKVYEENPLTIQDLYNKLGDNNSNKLQNNINILMNKICDAFSNVICMKKHGNTIKYQIFGADVAPLDNLEVKIMEINKGPDLRAKDKRDGKLKNNMQNDILKTVLNNDIINTNFIRIY